REGWGEVQPEEVSLQLLLEVGQCLSCSDLHGEVIPPSWGQDRQETCSGSAGAKRGRCQAS
ncbi:hypothetical protein ANANG_G00231180, partial [Anguilla anguilla]